MKHVKVLLISALLAWQFGNAQGIDFGIQGGFVNTDADIDVSILDIPLLNIGAVSESGFYLGVVVDIEATPKLHLQPELSYANAGDLSFIYLPVMLKYYVIPKVNIQVGPQFNFSTDLSDIKQAIEDIDGVLGTNTDLDDVLNSLAFDLGVGVGVDIIEKLRGQARYAIPLSDIYDGPLGGTLDIKNSTLQIGLVYMF